jgi:hypothetical protein
MRHASEITNTQTSEGKKNENLNLFDELTNVLTQSGLLQQEKILTRCARKRITCVITACVRIFSAALRAL